MRLNYEWDLTGFEDEEVSDEPDSDGCLIFEPVNERMNAENKHDQR